MIGTSEKTDLQNSKRQNHDFDLGIVGFRYSDLFDAVHLKKLAEKFYDELKDENPLVHQALTKYIENRGEGYEKKVESKILTDSAPYLSEFIGRMFKISPERDELQHEILKQNPIWQYKFFVQRRAARNFKADKLAELNESELNSALNELKITAFDETLIHDEELAIAEITVRLLEAEEIFTKNTEMTVSAKETIEKIEKAYEKLKDKTFRQSLFKLHHRK